MTDRTSPFSSSGFHCFPNLLAVSMSIIVSTENWRFLSGEITSCTNATRSRSTTLSILLAIAYASLSPYFYKVNFSITWRLLLFRSLFYQTTTYSFSVLSTRDLIYSWFYHSHFEKYTHFGKRRHKANISFLWGNSYFLKGSPLDTSVPKIYVII